MLTRSESGPASKVTRKVVGIAGFFLGVLLIYLLLNWRTGGRFLSSENIRTIMTHAVYPTILALGMSFIFAGGVIDLSIGAKVLLSANVGMICAYELNLGYAGLLLGAVLCCIVCQLASTGLIVFLKIPSWIAGLGTALVLEAILAEYSTSRIRVGRNTVMRVTDELRAFGTMPLMLIVMIVCFVIVFILFNYTRIGVNIQAVGSNASVAETMGVNRKKTLFIAAVIGAIFIGIASVVEVSYATRMEAATGLSSLSRQFRALAAVMLAQSISRIFNNIVGILISCIVLMSIFNALTMLGVPSGTWQNVTLGVVIVACDLLANIGYKGVVK